MKAPKEYRRWVNRMRSAYAKPNGVIQSWFFDCPTMEVKLENSKKNYNRQDLKYVRGRNRKRP